MITNGILEGQNTVIIQSIPAETKADDGRAKTVHH